MLARPHTPVITGVTPVITGVCGRDNVVVLGVEQIEEDKSQKRLPLETKNTQNHENRRLGLIESLHMHTVVCKAVYAP